MKTIHKYAVPIDGQLIEMPFGAEILKIDAAAWTHGKFPGNAPYIDPFIFCWAIVDTDQNLMTHRRINIIGTGHPLDEEIGEYISTIQFDDGALVLHFFDGDIA